MNEKPKILCLTTEYKNNPLGIDVARPRLSWKISSPESNVLQSAYRIQVAATVQGLEKEDGLLWDSGKVESSQSIHVEYAGQALESGQRAYWRVGIWTNARDQEWSSGKDFWEMGLLDSKDWKAQWISAPAEDDLSKACPVPLFRKEFGLEKKIRSARIHATSLGIYELRLNGQPVTDALFSPGWTSYNKRLQYQTYDVADMLSEGENAIGAAVGDGWYRGHLAGWAHPNRNHYGNELALLLQLEIKYEDGTSETIATGPSWKNSTGPIRAADFYMGESYDARLEKPGWDEPGYDGGEWLDVKILEHSKEMLIAQIGPPVKRMFEINPVEILATPEGDTVVDMGQNMVGWVKFKVRGRRGQTVTLRHAEVLDRDGNFYTVNLKGAKQEVAYTFAEETEVVFEPHFTFQGFRYFAIDGLDYTPALEDFKGEVIYSDMPLAGSFTCSDPLINQLQQNIQWGQRGNFVDVPTDCPQRQERLGWTGDAQVFAPTAAFNMGVAPFFTKWLGDLAADQREDGSVAHIVPYLDVLGEGNFGSAAWGDAAAVVPYTIYQYYGDTRILETQYESMKGWVEHLRKAAGDGCIHNTGFHYGDWLAYATGNSDYPGATTDKDIIATAYFGHSTRLLAETANVLGKEEDAAFYFQLLEKIRAAFDDEFISKNGRIGSNTQTAYAVALAFGLVPEEKERAAAEKYVADVRKFGHITTGFVGTPLVCLVLSKYGYHEEAYALLNRKEYPSWLYPVTKGATTIWERWDGIRPDGSFNTLSAFADSKDEEVMNSFNHYAYGAIGDWMYKVVAGIDFGGSGPGFKKILIKPVPGGGLTHAAATHESMYGTISSAWKIEGGKVVLEVEIPPNTTAEVFAPNLAGEYERHEVGSGKHVFTR